jgi:hypothetical protein
VHEVADEASGYAPPRDSPRGANRDDAEPTQGKAVSWDLAEEVLG